MGGAKKRSLAQSEKQQMQTQSPDKKQAKPKPSTEKKVGSIDLPELTEKELMAELSKMKAVTPYQVASRYNVKLGVAKTLLDKMEQGGHVQMVTRNGNLKIYRTIGAA